MYCPFLVKQRLSWNYEYRNQSKKGAEAPYSRIILNFLLAQFAFARGCRFHLSIAFQMSN